MIAQYFICYFEVKGALLSFWRPYEHILHFVVTKQDENKIVSNIQDSLSLLLRAKYKAAENNDNPRKGNCDGLVGYQKRMHEELFMTRETSIFIKKVTDRRRRMQRRKHGYKQVSKSYVDCSCR